MVIAPDPSMAWAALASRFRNTVGANLLTDLVAAHPNHDHVEKNEVRDCRFDEPERFSSRRSGDDLVPFAGEKRLEQENILRGVVNDENGAPVCHGMFSRHG
jgi:hypothetical protein